LVAYDEDLARPRVTLSEALHAHARSGVSATVGAAGDAEPTYPEFWARVMG